MKLKLNGSICHSIENVANVTSKDVASFLEDWFDDKDYVVANTSGSTGKPKEIKLSKSDMTASASVTNEFFGIDSSSKLLLCLSPSYIAGKMMIVRWLISSSNLFTLSPSSNPLSDFCADIDFAAMVPSQVKNILLCQETRVRLTKVKNLIIGGAPIDDVVSKQLENISVCSYSTYGMTETMSHVALRRIGKDNYYSALNNILFEQDDRGCLVLNVPHLSVKRIVTNDVVELLDSRHFIWKSRYDNIINSGGIKIYPEEIERELQPYINTRFYVIGKPDPMWGEKCVIVVEDDMWEVEKINYMKNIFKSKLPSYKYPKEILFLKYFTETTSGKVIRKLP